MSYSPFHFILITQTHFRSRPDRSLSLPFLPPYFRDALLWKGLLLNLFSILPFSYDCYPQIPLPLLYVPASPFCLYLTLLAMTSPFRFSLSHILFFYRFIHHLLFSNSAMFFWHVSQKFFVVIFYISMPHVHSLPSRPAFQHCSFLWWLFIIPSQGLC